MHRWAKFHDSTINSCMRSISSKMANSKKKLAEKYGVEGLVNCDVMSHAKKEICDISGAKRDFEFIFSAKESLDHIVYVCQKSQFCKILTCEPVP